VSVCLFSTKPLQLESQNMTQIFQDESCKPVDLGSKVKVPSKKTAAGVGLCTLVSSGFFSFIPLKLRPYGAIQISLLLLLLLLLVLLLLCDVL